MEIQMIKKVPVHAKTLRLCLKVRDEFTCAIFDQDGLSLTSYEGYVPGFMPGPHYGDYVKLDIDIDTGQITNWVPPTAKTIEAFIAREES